MTFEIALALAVSAATVVLFISEWLRVDVIAIAVMLTLAWLKLVTPAQAFSGFAGNAVMSIIAVMILGHGVDRSGVMQHLTGPVVRLAGASERRLTALVSAAVGFISAFMQNIGAAALFLPALLRIARRMHIPESRLLMPMGFAAILGGTLTMVASGPLIVLNDLLRQAEVPTFGLFSVTPVGLALLAAGLLYFFVFGKSVLPARASAAEGEDAGLQQKLIETWKLPSTVHECTIAPNSPLVGKTREEAQLWQRYRLNLLALAEGDDISYAPWRYTRFAAGQTLALMGPPEEIERFTRDGQLTVPSTEAFRSLREGQSSGFAELIIPPRAPLVGKTLRQVALRKHHGVEPILLLSGAAAMREDFSDQTLQAGDAMIVHGRWETIKALDDRTNFVLVTPIGRNGAGRSNPVVSLACFLGAIALVLLGAPLAVGLLTGVLAMIILRVLSIDEAYRAVDWRTVFLLAGLIPLGVAMDNSGAARYISEGMIRLLGGQHPLVIMTGVGILATLFSLFMSNVAATVLLVPLVILMGQQVDVAPRALALLVAICASNSFVLPTHQVNALLMSPGGYRNADYIKAGGIMTVLFLAVAVGLVYLIYT